MKNLPILAILIFACLVQVACTQQNEEANFIVEGLKPVYASEDDNWQDIYTSDARPVGQLGKIYYKDEIIFVNELDEGIHIIDNSNPANPTPLKFIHIPGSKDISIKGNFLYTDNVLDLVVLDISDFENISVVNRIADIYPPTNQLFPEFGSGYFECADTEKGIILRWKTAMLTNPLCRQ